MVTPANVIRMDELDKSETIVGLSYLKSPVETDTTIIKENKINYTKSYMHPKKQNKEKMTQALSIPEQKTPKSKRGFEYELTTKQKFYLYIFHVCPAIEILHLLWKDYILYRDRDDIRVFHIQNSPFKPHPCGYDSIFKSVCGYIDPDMFLDYYHVRELFIIY